MIRSDIRYLKMVQAFIQPEKFPTHFMYCYPAFYLVLNHATFKQIKKRHNINYSDGFYIGLLYAVPLVLS